MFAPTIDHLQHSDSGRPHNQHALPPHHQFVQTWLAPIDGGGNTKARAHCHFDVVKRTVVCDPIQALNGISVL